MRYGYFDDENREYVIDHVNTPVPWTNYIGVNDMCAVLSQSADGYVFYKSPQYHRITRFRPNAPISRPGHYVYLRDDDTGEYWSISWQPVGKDLTKAKYECRHGLSYSKYSCEYNGISACQTIFIPLNEPVELWDVVLKNNSSRPRCLSIYSYIEFSFHQIDMDNQNFQMSLYASGSSYADGIIEYDLYYEESGYQWFTSSFEPDGFDCLRDRFLGAYRDERNPIAVERGECTGSFEKTGNHCAALQKKLVLQPGQDIRIAFLLGEGKRETAAPMREKYSDPANVDRAFSDLAAFWDEKLSKLQVNTPNQGMNTSLNIWNLYQAEVNIMFSRFASFIEVGGRTGLGFRDTSQDAMTIASSNPEKCRQRIIELCRGLTQQGYGLHLFQPEWFDPEFQGKQQSFKSPTVIPTPSMEEKVHGIKDACSDDALWLIAAISEYIKETGEVSLLDEMVTYADGGEGTVYQHMMRILDFSAEQVGATGICKGLRADWNDCLNLGGGESAMVSFLHYWALQHFLALSRFIGKTEEVEKYEKMAAKVKKACNDNLWDGEWYIRGITGSGRKIGTHDDKEGKVHIESNAWAVFSGVADLDRAVKAMDSVDKYLYTRYGLMLNAPSYTKSDDEIGFVTRVYPGVKENGSIFSHPNPWAWCAEAALGRGDRAMKFYNALLPYNQNDKIEVRQSEPYSYCQFVMGKDHTAFGRARHPFMTGSGGWAYFAATRYLLGVRPDFDHLIVDPCIPKDWGSFDVTRVWRGAVYRIHVENPCGVSKGVKTMEMDGKTLSGWIPVQKAGTQHSVHVVMG
ncbi:N,N'-diacetylchitobiose phosphorylase [Caproiciproducens galactitolivorans]|uniref:N,N'-diacetylchitobiose phosphorylase n=1 Tax=Caproiciproducens galactitolivorans TaxID=642589 RepID=A0A4Z0YE76_9FIRM|nr:GH116 family glycosyl hydrolase [Caproiciproducens galactitolivorans]QEY35486.1 N,N'-diacetylchitobiose phosphorylase [Caproiciproducens galactitolivorans]TGJ77200.1 N,N'-diacetylchitobiose phosphorylase [Caproiciproducens galactitolivorans]